MGIYVCKFGGSSLADADGIRRAKEIMLADPRRRYIVPSAPGKRFHEDEKVTDMLYRCYRALELGEDIEPLFDKVVRRYTDIVKDLGMDYDMSELLNETKAQIIANKTPDFAASRGEYLNGMILSKYLGWDFVDPAKFVRFNHMGFFDSELTNLIMGEELRKHEFAVIPGFYGGLPDGTVRTFSRGGSDISGAIVARAVKAEMYENWTDVSGFMMVDPRIVNNPRRIEKLTYSELRELSYMGATVLHSDAVFPVQKAGIPTNIRNTWKPEHPGTMIVARMDDAVYDCPITGIAGHKDFSLISIEKAMMNSELGFGRRVLQAIEEFGISFEHLPTGIDTMSVIIADKELNRYRDQLIARINEMCKPDHIEISTGIALIATVGHGMVQTKGTAARLFQALYQADVNVRMIDQGSSELNIIVGVSCDEFERAVCAIYEAFVR